jgi:sulfur-carrier protein
VSRITVVVPPSLRQFVAGNSRIALEAATVREALQTLSAESKSLRGHLFDQNGGLRRFVRVFVDGRQAAVQPGQEEPVSEGAEMTILVALAGG